MCGLLPCEFWRAVIVFPGYALTTALAVGFLLALLAVCIVQSRPVANLLDNLHRRFWRLPSCGPDGCYCRRTCLWMLGYDPQEVRNV